MNSPPTPPRARKTVEASTSTLSSTSILTSTPSTPVAPLQRQPSTQPPPLPTQSLFNESQSHSSHRGRYIHMPNEMYLAFFEIMSTSDLLTTRQASQRMKQLVDVVLETRIGKVVDSLHKRREDAEARYVETERNKRPHLRHYRQVGSVELRLQDLALQQYSCIPLSTISSCITSPQPNYQKPFPTKSLHQKFKRSVNV